MKTKQLDQLDARIRVLSIALQEVCRGLPRGHAAEVTQAVRSRMADLPAEACADCSDAATAQELSPLLAALA